MENNMTDEIIKNVINQVMQNKTLDLNHAKKLIEKIEVYAKSKGLPAVITVCNPQGNIIAIHVMDDAYLASFDVSMNKAYTAVALKMTTMELAKLAQPGQTFYGVEHTNNGKIVIFGGGVPLYLNGKIIGGLGISGGTGEQDHDVAQYGQSVLEAVMNQ